MDSSEKPGLRRPVSQYINKQNSLLQQALSHIPGPLPQPISILQQNLNLIPLYMRNLNLYKQIHAYNKKLIQDQFSDLCSNVVKIYQGSRKKVGVDYGQFYEQVGKLLVEYQGEGSSYVGNWNNGGNQVGGIGVQGEFLRKVLMKIAGIHVQFFCLNWQLYTAHARIPEKYEQIINEKVNKLQRKPSNFFEELVLNPLAKQTQQNGVLYKIQAQAEQAATYLTNLFNQRHEVDAKQVIKKQKSMKPKNSLVDFQPFVFSYGQGEKTEIPQDTGNFEHQQILNKLVLAVQSQRLSTGLEQFSEELLDPQIQFQNWFTNTFSQMTYYESYMMAHMADLIFLHPDRFEIKYLKYDPYFSHLQKQIKQQMINFKSEEEAYRILFQSKYKGYDSRQLDHSPKIIQPQQKDKKSNKITIGKAIGALQDLYHKAKKQLKKNDSKQKQCLEVSFDKDKFIQQNQNLIVPQTFTMTRSYYQNIIKDLQYFSKFLKDIYEMEHKRFHGNLFESIKSLAEEIKNKIYDDIPYYHEIQSWMAIVIILYKQLAMNKLNNYDYTPFKRRSIIRICKRIFIEQKKAASKDKKEKHQNPYKNWPVVLKFLQNNRPQILQDALCSANEKEVDKILQQLYAAIEKKRLDKSSFGNLFSGIENSKESIPQIKLVCLSNGSSPNQNLNKGKTTTQCKVVHILISGFLSQDTNKLDEWSEMVDIMSDSEVYALVWESNTIKNLVKFFLRSAADVIGAAKMIDQIRRKYTDNPFNPAFEVAQITGRILAELIIRLFPNRFVNVCGYSLGSEVIKQFLNRMVAKKQTHLINNIYIMGGVSDNSAFADLISRSEVPLSVYNCYTNNDSVLRHLLSLCKPDITPVGLHQISKIEGHSVINVDCTKFISGHLAFRSNLRLMGEVLQLSTG